MMDGQGYPIVDIHSHVLPGVDDGAKSEEESRGMLLQAAACGTSDIVATPHSDLRYKYDPIKVDEWIATLGSPEHPRLHRGCDFHLYFDNIRAALTDPARFSINGLGYLLVEFSDQRIEAATGRILAELQEAGLTPIITHPERNGLLRQRLNDLRKWVDQGCLIQITGGSILGDFGRQARAFCDTLMNERMVHFVASDAHDLKYRTTDLMLASSVARSRWGYGDAERVFSLNGMAALAGIALDISRRKRAFAWL